MNFFFFFFTFIFSAPACVITWPLLHGVITCFDYYMAAAAVGFFPNREESSLQSTVEADL